VCAPPPPCWIACHSSVCMRNREKNGVCNEKEWSVVLWPPLLSAHLLYEGMAHLVVLTVIVAGGEGVKCLCPAPLPLASLHIIRLDAHMRT
jgi:hypothetical protein